MKTLDDLEYKHLKIIHCECGSHGIGVSGYNDDPEIFIQWWNNYGENTYSFWRRLRNAYQCFKTGMCLTHDVILYKKEVDELIDELIEVSNFVEQPKEIENE